MTADIGHVFCVLVVGCGIGCGMWKGVAIGIAMPCAMLVVLTLAVAFPNPTRPRATHTPATALSREFTRLIIPGTESVPPLPAVFADAPSPGPDVPIMLLLHGRSRSKEYILPAAAGLSHAQVGVLAFDFPSHGEHGFGRTTVGWREADAVGVVLDYLASAHPSRPVIVFGTSMGGAAGIMALGRDIPDSRKDQVLALITDGTFAELADVPRALCMRILGLPLPDPVLWVVDAILSSPLLWNGISLWDVSPLAAAPHLTVPAFFMHGESDPLVPSSAAQRLADAAPHGKAYLYPGGHDEPENPEVQKAVKTFVSMAQILTRLPKSQS